MTEEQWMPGNKKELMSALEHEWNLLIQLAEKLTDAQMAKPDAGGWSPKDNLAHISAWMKLLLGHHMDHLPEHEVLNIPAETEKDAEFNNINSAIFENNKNRSRKEVLDELKQVYGELHSRLNAMSFEDLLKPRHAEDPQKRPLLLWVLGDTTEHFLEHRETIERGLKEK